MSETRRVRATARGRRVFEESGAEPAVSSHATTRIRLSQTATTTSNAEDDFAQTRAKFSSREKANSGEYISSVSRLNIKDKDRDDSANEDDQAEKHQPEDEERKKTAKKTTKSSNPNSAKKRQNKKNLREKRRSTGVVIMPGQPQVAADEEERLVQENTARNMDSMPNEDLTGDGDYSEDSSSTHMNDDDKEQLREIMDELAKARKEIEALRAENQRFKDENSALLRVVSSLSGSRK